jgi:hypothetical protein
MALKNRENRIAEKSPARVEMNAIHDNQKQN